MADRFPDAAFEEWDLDRLAVATIRTLAIDGVQKANSGHPGMPLGAAPMAHVLWTRHLKFDSADPAWPDRDRFVLSAGHGSMLLYALLHLAGYGLSLEELEAFRQWGSRTPGPSRVRPHARGGDDHRPAWARGSPTAWAWPWPRPSWRRRSTAPGFDLVDHRTYGIVGDGDLMEGVASEAASLAGHLRLGQADLPVRRQPHHHRGLHRPGLHRGRGCAVRGLRLAGARQSRTATTWTPSTRPSPTPGPRPSSPRSSWCAPSSATAAPTRRARRSATARPLGPEEISLTKEALGWPADLFFAVPERVQRQYGGGRGRRGGRVAPLVGDARALRAAVSRARRAVGRRPWPGGCRQAGRTRSRSSRPARVSPPGPLRARC